MDAYFQPRETPRFAADAYVALPYFYPGSLSVRPNMNIPREHSHSLQPEQAESFQLAQAREQALEAAKLALLDFAERCGLAARHIVAQLTPLANAFFEAQVADLTPDEQAEAYRRYADLLNAGRFRNRKLSARRLNAPQRERALQLYVRHLL